MPPDGPPAGNPHPQPQHRLPRPTRSRPHHGTMTRPGGPRTGPVTRKAHWAPHARQEVRYALPSCLARHQADGSPGLIQSPEYLLRKSW